MAEAIEKNESSNQDKEHPLTQRAIKILGELDKLDLSLKAIGRAVGKSDRTLRNILWGTKPSELLVNALEMYLKHQKQWEAKFKSKEPETEDKDEAEPEPASNKVQEGGSSYASLHRLIEITEKSYALQEKSHALLQTLVKGVKKEESEEVPPKSKKRSKKQSPPDYPNSK